MRKQRLIGLGLVGLSWVLLALILAGETLLTLPLGVYMLFTEEYILYP